VNDILTEKDNPRASSVNEDVWHTILIEIIFLWGTTTEGCIGTVIFFVLVNRKFFLLMTFFSSTGAGEV
jgi:hypothetical protein